MLETSCRCQVDALDRIIVIEGAWLALARNNGGETLLESSPIGRPIWELIEGDTTKNILSLVMKKIRRNGQTIRFPFRCDSPDQLRYMEMEMSLAEKNGIWFETSTIKILDRTSSAVSAFTVERQSIGTFLRLCAWCSDVLVRAEWVPVEDAIWMLGLFDTPNPPPISHGICPDCAKKWLGKK